MNGFFLSRQVRHRIESLAPMLKKNFDIIHPDDVLNLIPLDGNTTANNASGSTSRAAGTKTSTGGGGGGKGADKSSTSLEDLIYFVRKAMRPRFQAMVNELKAQAELRRAAEAARGAATSAVQAQRHHHHRAFTPILFLLYFCSEEAFTMNTIVRSYNCYYCCCCLLQCRYVCLFPGHRVSLVLSSFTTYPLVTSLTLSSLCLSLLRPPPPSPPPRARHA